LLIIWYCSHVEATDAVAVKNEVPAAVAVTKLLLAIARMVAASLVAEVARAASKHPMAHSRRKSVRLSSIGIPPGGAKDVRLKLTFYG
jgi:hypothetical protein